MKDITAFLRQVDIITGLEPNIVGRRFSELLEETRKDDLTTALAELDRDFDVIDYVRGARDLMDFILEFVLTEDETVAVRAAIASAQRSGAFSRREDLARLFITCCLCQNLSALEEITTVIGNGAALHRRQYVNMYDYIDSGSDLAYDWWVNLEGRGEQ